MASTRPPCTREGVLVTELRRRAPRGAATLMVSVLATASLSATSPAIGRDEWRRQAAEARRLAENDAPRAYELAKRLDAEAPADATPADRALALNLLARIELYLAMTDRAAEHARTALALADQHGDRIGQAEALLTQAINSINQGDISALIASASRSLTVVEGIARPDLVSEAFLRTSMMYRRVGKIEESVQVAMRGMEMARRSKDPVALIYAHQGLGISFDQSFRYAEARTHYSTMLDLARKVGYRLQQGYATGSLGGVLASLGDAREGERLIREAIDHYRTVGAPFAVAFGLSNLAYALRGQKRYAEALAINNEVVDIYGRHRNRIGLWYALNFRSENLLSLGQPAPARADVERARAVAQEIGLPTYTSESARRLASLIAAAGDHQRAYALSVEAHDIATAAARETASTRMVELAERIASESRQRELDALTRQTAAQAAEIRQQTLERRWLQTLAAAALLVLAVATFFLIRLRRAHRTLQAESAQRQAAETEVRALNATLEQQVRERTAQLESANRELEAFSYSVSHDLRAPLRAVDGFSRALLEDHGDRLDEAARAGIDRIRGAARRMSQLVDALLQLARVTRSDLHRAPIDVTALVSSIADELRQREAAPAVDFAIAPNLRASADRRLLLVLFQNLFENACKFSNGRAGARVECGVTTRDGHAAWFVRDNGVGFDMAYAHRLFGPFQRLHSEAEFPGSGIGLATVQRIVHRHGGRIWAESRPGEGATFYFTLPEPVGS